ncbi:MAG TPA: MarR family winged helix-turn-helix transcriptional regulator [Acidimicrobiales bacterium]|nr:MarR family winged helix-turn-helix transcriptional regulator [Acidimicrobiales bacterium]
MVAREPSRARGRASLSDDDYRRLLALRTRLRGFLRWSEAQARSAGLAPAQHQLLLAIRGHDDPRGPTIGEVAGYLYLRHHSAVELAGRAQEAGLVEREADPDDARVVRLRLTQRGEAALAELTQFHLGELRRLAAHLQPLLRGFDFDQEGKGRTRAAS